MPVLTFPSKGFPTLDLLLSVFGATPQVVPHREGEETDCQGDREADAEGRHVELQYMKHTFVLTLVNVVANLGVNAQPSHREMGSGPLDRQGLNDPSSRVWPIGRPVGKSAGSASMYSIASTPNRTGT